MFVAIESYNNVFSFDSGLYLVVCTTHIDLVHKVWSP